MNADKWATMEVIAERNKHANTTFGALAAAYLELLAEQTTLRARLAEVEQATIKKCARMWLSAEICETAIRAFEPAAAQEGSTQATPGEPAPAAVPDEDGHCTVCGLKWPDERETLEPHECPPGFCAVAPTDIEYQNTWNAKDHAGHLIDKHIPEWTKKGTQAAHNEALRIEGMEIAKKICEDYQAKSWDAYLTGYFCAKAIDAEIAKRRG